MSPWTLLFLLVPAGAWLYQWKVAGPRKARTSLEAFDRWMGAQVDEPLLAVSVGRPGGTVGRDARSEWKGAIPGLVARAATGVNVTTRSSEIPELPPWTAIGVGEQRVHLLPCVATVAGTYEATGPRRSLDRTGLKVRTRPGVLTVQIELESAGEVIHLEVARDPLGRHDALVSALG